MTEDSAPPIVGHPLDQPSAFTPNNLIGRFAPKPPNSAPESFLLCAYWSSMEISPTGLVEMA